MKRIVFLLLLFFVVDVVAATNWYVRPRSSIDEDVDFNYGNEDGTSCTDAWDGWDDFRNNSDGDGTEDLGPGDTVYLCGTDVGLGNAADLTVDGTPEAPITLDGGNCPCESTQQDHGGNFKLVTRRWRCEKEDWTHISDGVYSDDGGSCNPNGNIATAYVLEEGGQLNNGSQPDSGDADGSFWCDIPTTTCYWKPVCELNDTEGDGPCYDLLVGTYTDPVSITADYIRIKNFDLLNFGNGGISMNGDRTSIHFDNIHVEHGITAMRGIDQLDLWQDFRVTNSTFTDIKFAMNNQGGGTCVVDGAHFENIEIWNNAKWYDSPSDDHAWAFRCEVRNAVYKDLFCHDWVEDCFNIYNENGGDKYNVTFDNVRCVDLIDNPSYPPDYSACINLNGENANSPTTGHFLTPDTFNNIVITNSHIQNVEGCGIRVKASGGAAGRPGVIVQNTVFLNSDVCLQDGIFNSFNGGSCGANGGTCTTDPFGIQMFGNSFLEGTQILTLGGGTAQDRSRIHMGNNRYGSDTRIEIAWDTSLYEQECLDVGGEDGEAPTAHRCYDLTLNEFQRLTGDGQGSVVVD